MILDGNTRVALALTRDLGRKKIRVIVGGPSILSRAFYSKYTAAHFLCPDNSGYNDIILDNVKRHKPDVLMPVLDKSFEIIIKNKKDYIPHTNLVPLPDYTAFKLINNKYTLMRHASRENISIPKTFYLDSIDDARSLREDLPYPVLVKPRVSAGGFGIGMVSAPDLLSDQIYRTRNLFLSDSGREASFPIIQEYIEGEVANFYAYCEKGDPKAIFMTKTIRQYPLRFGPGIASVSIRDESIAGPSLKLLKSLEWEGVISLQYIIDKRDDTPKLIDANPRLWGTIEAAMVYGVNFPYMLFKRALGGEIDAIYEYSQGKKFRWVLFGELFYLLKTDNRLRAIADYLEIKDTKCELSLSDILPHIVQTLSLLINRLEVR